jgi:hypothetical protein
MHKILKHGAGAVLEGGLIAVIAIGLVAGSALAAKPAAGGTGGGGMSVVVLNSTDGSAHWGGEVTFRFSTSNPYPVASATCSQGGVVVYGDSHPMYQPNPWNDPGTFVLSSQAWSGGSATCTALLKGTSHGKVVTLASVTFTVLA